MSNVDLTRLATVLEKSAEYVGELETRVKDLEQQLEKAALEKDAGLVTSLKEKGFSDEDIAGLRTLQRGTLEKVATAESKAWDIGAGHQKSASQLDPIMAFILN